MKLGIFLGSFDPIHMGHLNIISTIINYNILNKILIVPSYCNPWKDTKTPYIVRVLMTERACRIYRRKVEVLTLERGLSQLYKLEKVPTYLTLRHLNKRYANDELYIITTVQTLLEIPKWKNGDEVLENYKFITLDNSTILSKKQKDFVEKYANYVFPIPRIDVSSTLIRDMLHKDYKQIYPLVPEAVARIIRKHKLYE